MRAAWSSIRRSWIQYQPLASSPALGLPLPTGGEGEHSLNWMGSSWPMYLCRESSGMWKMLANSSSAKRAQAAYPASRDSWVASPGTGKLPQSGRGPCTGPIGRSGGCCAGATGTLSRGCSPRFLSSNLTGLWCLVMASIKAVQEWTLCNKLLLTMK